MAGPLTLAFFLCANAALVIADSSHWAGAGLSNVRGVTEVKGTITLPKVPSNNQNTLQGAAFWVGIDGLSCPYAILQTGVSVLSSGGITKYEPFVEWYPEKAIFFDGFKVSPGDTIAMSVRADSLTSGSATLENLTNKAAGKVTHTYSGMSTGLCLNDASWVVEKPTRYSNGGGAIEWDLINFGTATFTNTQAFTLGDKYVGANGPGSTVLNIKGKTSCRIDAGTKVTCSYV